MGTLQQQGLDQFVLLEKYAIKSFVSLPSLAALCGCLIQQLEQEFTNNISDQPKKSWTRIQLQ
eukprot:5838827-Amphidinium_carterae.1